MSGVIKLDKIKSDNGYSSGASDCSYSDNEFEFTKQILCSCCEKCVKKPRTFLIAPKNEIGLEFCSSDCYVKCLELVGLVSEILNFGNTINDDRDKIVKLPRTPYNSLDDICEDREYFEISSTLRYIISLEKKESFSKITKDSIALKVVSSWFICNDKRIRKLALILQRLV